MNFFSMTKDYYITILTRDFTCDKYCHHIFWERKPPHTLQCPSLLDAQIIDLFAKKNDWKRTLQFEQKLINVHGFRKIICNVSLLEWVVVHYHHLMKYLLDKNSIYCFILHVLLFISRASLSFFFFFIFLFYFYFLGLLDYRDKDYAMKN